MSRRALVTGVVGGIGADSVNGGNGDDITRRMIDVGIPDQFKYLKIWILL